MNGNSGDLKKYNGTSTALASNIISDSCHPITKNSAALIHLVRSLSSIFMASGNPKNPRQQFVLSDFRLVVIINEITISTATNGNQVRKGAWVYGCSAFMSRVATSLHSQHGIESFPN